MMQKGTLLMDSSTIDPSVSQEIATKAEELGASFVDSPVSGGRKIQTYLIHLLKCDCFCFT